MNLFKFLTDNKDNIEELEDKVSGNDDIDLTSDQFDFSYDDIKFILGKEEENYPESDWVEFRVQIGKYNIYCSMTYSEIIEEIDNIKKICNRNLREQVIETIEKEIIPFFTEKLEAAKDEVIIAEEVFKETKENLDGIKDVVVKTKNFWGVP